MLSKKSNSKIKKKFFLQSYSYAILIMMKNWKSLLIILLNLIVLNIFI